MSGTLLIYVLLLLLVLYVLPTAIAVHRRHPQQTPIFVINLLLGWTLIGWAVALAWALFNYQPRVAQ